MQVPTPEVTDVGAPLFADIHFSWKRALGITKAKQQFARKKGIPTSKAGLERKIGASILKFLFGEK